MYETRYTDIGTDRHNYYWDDSCRYCGLPICFIFPSRSIFVAIIITTTTFVVCIYIRTSCLMEDACSIYN